ncbi:hypothetical protein V5799_005767 [Amblyomma americanum]|uniref:Cytochrome n=1 Tax=Amblyomma americanum TaxID=6943 RepID=A0AAQ4DYB0_AMBAM
MGKAILFVADPKLVKDVLVKNFKSLPNRRTFSFNEPLLDNMMSMAPVEIWQKVRPAANPAFSIGKLRKMNSLIEDCALVTTEHLKSAASRQEDIDVKQFFWDYMLDVTARSAFATKLDSHSEKENEFVMRSRQLLSKGVTPRLLLILIFPTFAKKIGLSPFTPGVLQFFKKVLRSIIKNKENEQDENFFRLIMGSQEETGGISPESSPEKDNPLFNLNSGTTGDTFSGTKLTEEEAMAQCILFFLAGQEKERKWTSASRLTLERSPCQDFILGDTGIKVKKNDIVAVPVYALHHDPQYFPDPLTFNPERFSEQNMASIDPYTYLPFGAGPRSCIAMRFALHTVKVSVLHTIRNVQLVRTEKTKVPLEFPNGFGHIIAKDVILGVRKRE